jgi:hypothetical protein
MSLQIPTAPHIPDVPQKLGPRGRIFFWISAIVSFGLLGYLILVVAHQMLVPPPAQRLIIVQDIPLPSGLANNAQQATSLAPGVELQFDGFDFQAYDAATHRLFIAHTDLHKIFAADSEDNIIYDINVNTMQIEGQIQLPDNEGPDAVGYEPVDHRIFVSSQILAPL